MTTTEIKKNEKFCPVCLRYRSLEKFHTAKRRPLGRQWSCKECHRAYAKQRGREQQHMRLNTAYKRLNRTLQLIRRMKGTSEQRKEIYRIQAVQDSMRIKHGWFDRVLSAEEHRPELSDGLQPNKAQRGKNNPQAKLTDAKVRFIRSCTLSPRGLGEIFEITLGQISLIRSRKAWVHVA